MPCDVRGVWPTIVGTSLRIVGASPTIAGATPRIVGICGGECSLLSWSCCGPRFQRVGNAAIDLPSNLRRRQSGIQCRIRQQPVNRVRSAPRAGHVAGGEGKIRFTVDPSSLIALAVSGKGSGGPSVPVATAICGWGRSSVSNGSDSIAPATSSSFGSVKTLAQPT